MSFIFNARTVELLGVGEWRKDSQLGYVVDGQVNRIPSDADAVFSRPGDGNEIQLTHDNLIILEHCVDNGPRHKITDSEAAIIKAALDSAPILRIDLDNAVANEAGYRHHRAFVRTSAANARPSEGKLGL